MRALCIGKYMKTSLFIDAANSIGDEVVYDGEYEYILPQPYVSADMLVLPECEDFARICLDKKLFNEFCNDHSFKVPSETDTFPCVVKPTVGEGSVDVYIANHEPTFDHLKQELIEETLIGLNVAVVDGEVIVYHKWVVESTLPDSIYLVNAIQTSDNIPLSHSTISEVERIIEALHIDNSVLQIELFVDSDDEFICFVEINPRIGSVGIESMAQLYDYDPVVEAVKLYSGRECNFIPYTQYNKSLCFFACRKTEDVIAHGDVTYFHPPTHSYKEPTNADEIYQYCGIVHTIDDTPECAINTARAFANDL
jgi:biotin carboxylase